MQRPLVLTQCFYRQTNAEIQLQRATNATVCDAVAMVRVIARSFAFLMLPVGAPFAGGDAFR